MRTEAASCAGAAAAVEAAAAPNDGTNSLLDGSSLKPVAELTISKPFRGLDAGRAANGAALGKVGVGAMPDAGGAWNGAGGWNDMPDATVNGAIRYQGNSKAGAVTQQQ